MNKKTFSKILIICLIIIIPVAIWIFGYHKMSVKPVKQDSSPKGGVYSQKDNSPVTYDQPSGVQLPEQNRQTLSASDAKIKIDLIRRGNPLAATEDYTAIY